MYFDAFKQEYIIYFFNRFNYYFIYIIIIVVVVAIVINFSRKANRQTQKIRNGQTGKINA